MERGQFGFLDWAVNKKAADLLRLADHILFTEFHAHGLYDNISQAFTVFLPVRSVAVMGDGRQFDWVIALRAVETVDFMTAHLRCAFLAHVSHRIANEIKGISRVLYDISSKPQATIQWE
jgi:GMP synthase (glutamine-hydrolysing)